jgi:hypothetical protein
MKFKVFGLLIALERREGHWHAYYFGNEGKKRPADFVVPPDLPESEVEEYLADLFHEHATPRNSEVIRL